MQKVKINWSFYKLPGFRKARYEEGFVRCPKCFQEEKLGIPLGECTHEEEEQISKNTLY